MEWSSAVPDQAMLFVNTAVAIVGIVLAITWLKFPPVFALLFGTLYLGLTTAVGFEGTIEAVSDGFADVMGGIGILITFGVILGALMTVTNTMQRLVEAMLNLFGKRSIPYVFVAALSSLFTSIYSDVLLVLSAPMAKRLSPRMGLRGRALMGGALTAGIEVGLVFVAPGVAAVALAAILGVPLGQMFLLGLVVGLPTALLTMLAYAALLHAMKWDPDLDQLADTDPTLNDEPDHGAETSHEMELSASHDESGTDPVKPTLHSPDRSTVAGGGQTVRTQTAPEAETTPHTETVGTRVPDSVRELPLFLSVTPVLLTLLLIAGGAIANGLSIDVPAVAFFTNPIVALFLGATLAYALASRVRTKEEIGKAVGNALTQCGPILVLSGISGSLAFVIERSGMADILGNAFSAGFLPPLLLVWLVAAVLHIALGSISVASITAAGILAPIADTLGTPVVLIALAAGSGALFLPHVSSNFFWMFQSLLGFTTRGTIKTHTIPMTLASVISLPLILAMSLFA